MPRLCDALPASPGAPARPGPSLDEWRARREAADLAAAREAALGCALRRAGVVGFSDRARGRRLWDAARGGAAGWLLFGPPGTGKTSAAVGAVEEAVRAGASARLVTEAGMLAELRAAATDGQGEEPALLRRLCGYDLLAVDDMGKGEVTPKMFARLFEVVDRRTRAGLATLCTSNYAPAQLAARYAAWVGADDARPMASRLSTLRAVEMAGADMRLAGARRG